MKYLKNSLLILFVLLILFFDKLDNSVHSYIIDNIYLNDSIPNKVDYIGYIEIERLNIKREIVRNINNINLLNHVAMDETCQSLECDNIILAGHSVSNIFLNLKKIKKGDIINLINNDKKYSYRVIEIDIVDKSRKDAIDNSDLILITCYDFNRRIIVKAKRI